MIAIAAINPQWVMSKKHQLAFSIKQEREHFKEITKGKTVVYDLSMLQNLPNKQPLKQRNNIIITHDRNIRIPGAITVADANELKFVLKSYESNDIYLVGGAETFAELINDCSEVILSVFHEEIDLTTEECEFFPNLDQLANWGFGKTSPEHLCGGHIWHYQRYVNFNYRKHSMVNLKY